MARKSLNASSLAGLLAVKGQARPPQAVALRSEPEPLPVPITAEQAPKIRLRGKRSDPDWKLYSHFLRRKTRRRAAAILAERDDGTDLSDVLQELLERWVAEQAR